MCLSPISLTRELAGRKITQVVPCNKCCECKSQQQSEFVSKCCEAAKQLGQVYFVTLTYNDTSVPECVFDGEGEVCEETGEIKPLILRTLNREDLKLWKKRVKQKYYRKYKTKLDLNYLICGEYGPQTHRPHYHGMFFGLTEEVAQWLKQDWEKNFGFTYFKYIPSIPIDGVDQVERTSRYCSKYCIKIAETEDPNVINGLVQKPRKVVSHGLGIPSAKRYIQMMRYHLAYDLYGEYDPDEIYKKFSPQKIKSLTSAILNRKNSYDGKNRKLPKYLQKKMLYKRDADGKYKATDLQKALSYAAQCRVEKDYIDRIREFSGVDNFREMPPEVFRKAQKSYTDFDKNNRKERAQTVIDYNFSYMRKSKL